MTNATIFYWESEADLQGGKSPCVAKITAFNEGSDPRMSNRVYTQYDMIVSFLFSSDMHKDKRYTYVHDWESSYVYETL